MADSESTIKGTDFINIIKKCIEDANTTQTTIITETINKLYSAIANVEISNSAMACQIDAVKVMLQAGNRPTIKRPPKTVVAVVEDEEKTLVPAVSSVRDPSECTNTKLWLIASLQLGKETFLESLEKEYLTADKLDKLDKSGDKTDTVKYYKNLAIMLWTKILTDSDKESLKVKWRECKIPSSKK